MKRRSFLASIAGIFTAPLVVKPAEAKPDIESMLADMRRQAGICDIPKSPLTATGCREKPISIMCNSRGVPSGLSINSKSEVVPSPETGYRLERKLRAPTSYDGIMVIPVFEKNGGWDNLYLVEKTGEQVARPKVDCSKYFQWMD